MNPTPRPRKVQEDLHIRTRSAMNRYQGLESHIFGIIFLACRLPLKIIALCMLLHKVLNIIEHAVGCTANYIEHISYRAQPAFSLHIEHSQLHRAYILLERDNSQD